MTVSQAQLRAKNKYNAKIYETITIRMRKNADIVQADNIRAAAEKAGESINTYILNAIADRMEAEGCQLYDRSEND